MQDAMDPLPDINVELLKTIRSYPYNLLMQLKPRSVVHMMYKMLVLEHYSNITKENVKKLHITMKINSNKLSNFKNSLPENYPNKYVKLIEYIKCATDFHMNVQMSKLMGGVKLEKSTATQKCFSEKKNTYDNMAIGKPIETCVWDSRVNENVKRKIIDDIEEFSINSRKYNYESYLKQNPDIANIVRRTVAGQSLSYDILFKLYEDVGKIKGNMIQINH
ncbi:unnamed protein product [Schistosoma turkestanicum]|nr:unnamed protein product [Schistosoma turkestanicum]